MDALTQSSPYLSGAEFGWPESVRVHRLANIAGQCEVGEHTRIDAFVTITGRVRIGKNAHLGTGCCLFGGAGTVFDDAGIVLGDGVGISPGAKLFTGTTDLDSGLISVAGDIERAAYESPIVIDRFTMIGANAVVMPGVKIGKCCQIGALSLVTKSLDEYGIYAGIPVKRLRDRPKMKYEQC